MKFAKDTEWQKAWDACYELALTFGGDCWDAAVWATDKTIGSPVTEEFWTSRKLREFYGMPMKSSNPA